MCTLRPATAADAPRIADVLLSSRKTFLPYACLAHPDEDVRRWVREQLLPCSDVTVACAGDGEALVIGVLATATDASGIAWIEQLYLAPGHTGQGTGSRLLAHALATLGRPLRLYTFQQNQRARGFYESHGFAAIAFTDGADNEERCPDVLYELR